jgi:Zn-dependent protease with chaperone function
MQQDSPLSVAKKSSDLTILIVTILVLSLAFVLIAEEKTVLFIVVVMITIASLFYIRLHQISFLGNAFRVQNGQHAYLIGMVQKIAQQLEMPTVDVFITQDPVLNAFALGYSKPYTIVLHSAIVEQLTKEELEAILFHEMAHIKLKHTIITAYLYPAGQIIPVLGPLFTWIFGFWSRRAELACDRVAVAYTQSPHIVISALMKVHVGSRFAEYLK